MSDTLRTLLASIPALLLATVVQAAEPRGPEIDMFDPPAGSSTAVVWKAFHEDPQADAEAIWKLADGVMVCQGSPKGYLYTETDFTNFVLRLEWRWPPDKEPGSGGVLVRMTGRHKIWPKSLEAQLNAGSAGDFWGLDGYQLTGPAERTKHLEHPQFGKLTNVQKAKDLEKPAGQWNRYEIVAYGDVVTISVNGQVVNKATGCEVVPGKILLTAEGDAIHFRRVRLTPILKPPR